MLKYIKMCTNLVSIHYICTKIYIMQVISAREFRANQTRILSAARSGQTIMLTSRVGNFKIVPITDEDAIVERDIRSSLSDVKAHMEGKIELPNARDLVF